MQRLLAATLLISMLARVVAADTEPWANEKPLVSPSRSFTIVQRRDSGWTTTVHFQHTNADVVLTDMWDWPALFYIAPDDRWILQVQKSGSGDNISFLFRVDPEGRLWRMEPAIMQLAWAFIERTESLHETALYHTGIDFRSWDLRSHLVRFTFHGTNTARQAHLDVPLTYDFQKHVIARDTKA